MSEPAAFLSTQAQSHIMHLGQIDLPGGNDFIDVTAIFAGAAQRTLSTSLLHMVNRTFAELDATEMVFADGYSLNDAMSALEVWRSVSTHAAWLSDIRARLENPAWTVGWL